MGYEWTDFDEGVQIIAPWHGLYRAADGKIEAANGVKTAVNGSAPNCYVQMYTAPGGAFVDFPACDSVLVRRPGLPTVTTPPTELALGKTWLNYNIQSGGEKVMSGRFCHNWLYQAPDGSRWYVSSNSYASLTNLNGKVTVSLSLHRFGEFTVAAEEQNIANQIINFTSQEDLDGEANALINLTAMVDDVTETGNKAVLAICHALGGDVISRRVVALLEVVISGQPPEASMTATLIAQSSDLEWFDPWYAHGAPFPPIPTYKTAYWAFSGGTWNYFVQDGDYQTAAAARIVLVVAGVADYYREYLVGGRYSASAVLEVIKGRVERHAVATADVAAGSPPPPSPPNGFALTGSETITGFARLMANGATISEITWNYSATGTEVDGVSSITNTATVGGFTTTGTNAMDAFTSTSGAAPGYAGTYMPINIYNDIIFQRYSNSLYGIVLRAPYDMSAPAAERRYWFGGVFGKLSNDPAILKPVFDGTNPIYASEHPVTGQIIRASAPCCWV